MNEKTENLTLVQVETEDEVVRAIRDIEARNYDNLDSSLLNDLHDLTEIFPVDVHPESGYPHQTDAEHNLRQWFHWDDVYEVGVAAFRKNLANEDIEKIRNGKVIRRDISKLLKYSTDPREGDNYDPKTAREILKFRFGDNLEQVIQAYKDTNAS